MTRPLVALTIAGSDPSGGAGVQADLKTFSALGAYGTAVLTALTAQSTRGVTGVHAVPAAFVAEQLATLAADVRIDAVKIGMLARAEVVDVVGAFLRDWDRDGERVVVLDPVMVATSGDPLLADDAVAAIRALLPRARLVTPNLPEAARLLDEPAAADVDAMLAQAERLRGLGSAWVLLKGGHLAGPSAVDVVVGPGVAEVLTGPRVATRHTHGTGCTLSSAVAVLAARLGDWPAAASAAKAWLTGALRAADTLAVGGGSGPVHHFHELWPAEG
ncbi:bifunctional hydroxymethylpyrimidine kinase/phosphomethylpyrimidine kinase [Actinotalea fermentans]|uniref:Hydroxymethylpyrimidine/phosphomethylpyrimidine kinase n=1 Tax=Actinotalea fermentans TaxID=43671 RepID=A0A511Z1B6_9CELL|nr:bifunctional hydroxymethylpyrimidine kinase/phosphomethylpyrimidine kinase [Actinotalea fermentans]GEN81248.1 hydroxymethylpyrimidine/phosphomethylpyrimidine kinase [Actinotalea fermentans]